MLNEIVLLLSFFFVVPGLFSQSKSSEPFMQNEKSSKKQNQEFEILKKDIDSFREEIKTFWKSYQKNYASIKPLSEFKKDNISDTSSGYPEKELYLLEGGISLKGKGEEVTDFSIRSKKSRMENHKPELIVTSEISGSFMEKVENLKLTIRTITPGQSSEELKARSFSIENMDNPQKLTFLRLYRNKLQEILKNLELYNNYYKLEKDDAIKSGLSDLSG